MILSRQTNNPTTIQRTNNHLSMGVLCGDRSLISTPSDEQLDIHMDLNNEDRCYLRIYCCDNTTCRTNIGTSAITTMHDLVPIRDDESSVNIIRLNTLPTIHRRNILTIVGYNAIAPQGQWSGEY